MKHKKIIAATMTAIICMNIAGCSMESAKEGVNTAVNTVEDVASNAKEMWLSGIQTLI